MNEQPHLSPEAPLRAIVANLEHLRGKSLPELVKQARYRRRRIVVLPAEGEPAQGLPGSLAEALEAARAGKLASIESPPPPPSDNGAETVTPEEGGLDSTDTPANF